MRDLSPPSLSPAPVLAASVIIATSQQSAWAAELSRVAFSKWAAQVSNFPSNIVDFGIVPGTAKRRYEITHVSCHVFVDDTKARIGRWHLQAFKDGDLIGRMELRPTFLGSAGAGATGFAYYNANQQGLVVVPGGGEIEVRAGRDSSTSGDINSMNCSIGGYDVRLE